MHTICQEIWKTQQWAQDWKKVVFIAIPKKGNAKECSHYRTIILISHTSKVMFKILQVRLNSMWTKNFQMFKLDLEKSGEPKVKFPRAMDHWKSKRISGKKKIYFSFTDYAKAFDCVDHNKQWKILKRDKNTRPPYMPPEKSAYR